jgi:hypothetical protein
VPPPLTAEWDPFYNVQLQLVEWIGHDAMVYVEDLLVFLSGLFVGAILITALYGKMARTVKRENSLKNVLLVKTIDDNGKTVYYMNPIGASTLFDALIALIKAMLSRKKQMKIRSVKRERIVFYIAIFLVLLLVLMAFYMIVTVIPDPRLPS